MPESHIHPRHDELIAATISYLKGHFAAAEGGHDWHHTERVWCLAKHIAEREPNAHRTIAELGALLHDIADAKFHGGDEEIGPRMAREWLERLAVEDDIVNAVVDIVRNISWKSNIGVTRTMTPELAIAQDADRLEALGAVGIARAFNYGGHNGVPIYLPDVAPNLAMTKEEYKKGSASTVNHFYEKLLLIKEKMNTATGKNLAAERHAFMERFLEEFFAETRGEK